MSLNLSSQPFVNSRPVRRLVLVLWCLSALLIAANLFFYTRHYSGQQARRDRLEKLTEREEIHRRRLSELDAELVGFDLDWQNRQVNFLNLRIAERVFPWSRLFDRLAEVLPREVRLTRLRPQIESLASAAAGPEEIVRLEIRAEARNEEAMLYLVSQLFEHPSFRDPNLTSENRRARSNVTEFSLTVVYLPASEPAAPAAEAPAPAGPAATGESTEAGQPAAAAAAEGAG